MRSRKGHLKGSLRTVEMTKAFRQAGVASFTTGRSASGIRVTKTTLAARILGKAPDLEALIRSETPRMGGETMAESVRLSLMDAFNQNPDLKEVTVNTAKFRWEEA